MNLIDLIRLKGKKTIKNDEGSDENLELLSQMSADSGAFCKDNNMDKLRYR